MAQPTNADPGHTTNMVYHQQAGQISQHSIPVTPGCSENYNGISGRATGWIQLCCAVGVTLIGVAQFLLGSSLRFIACGIWMSLLCFGPAGVLGIVSFRKRTCVISAYITMSVFSAIFAFFMMIIGAIGAPISGSFGCYAQSGTIPCKEGLVESRTASDAIMSVIGLIELIVAIVGSVYGCSGVCCTPKSSRPLQGFNVVNQYPAIVSTHQRVCPLHVPTGDHHLFYAGRRATTAKCKQPTHGTTTSTLPTTNIPTSAALIHAGRHRHTTHTTTDSRTTTDVPESADSYTTDSRTTTDVPESADSYTTDSRTATDVPESADSYTTSDTHTTTSSVAPADIPTPTDIPASADLSTAAVYFTATDTHSATSSLAPAGLPKSTDIPASANTSTAGD
eukprot:XP_011662705.1 PREDICTED: uncharacterized protein LOC105437607 [Strongylocentrotus purpuratus]